MTTSDSGEERDTNLQVLLGPLQRLIVAVLVDADEALPAKVVRDRLEDRGTERAQSTISTELTRLEADGIVRRDKEEYPGGFRYLYSPVEEFEDEYLETHLSVIQDVLGDESIRTLCQRVQERASEADSDIQEGLDCQ